MERPLTIRDVARAAGVGASTVSLALRNDPRLRPAMRERVQKIAREIGYLPNATLASLMAQLRAGKKAQFQATLGLLNASEESSILREVPTFREWLRGASERARELGYAMDLFWLHEPGAKPARLLEILRARNIRGLIVAGLQTDGILPASHAELWPSFSSVVIGMRPKSPPLHFTSNDQFSTARHAVEELRALGYQRIGLVLNPKIDAWLEHRFSAGFVGGPQGASAEMIFPFGKEECARFRAWYQAKRPDALLTLHVEVKAWLEEMGVKMPRDLGLAHLDRERTMTDWAGMDQNNYWVGASATDMIVGALHRNEQGVPDFPRAILLQSRWVPGTTVREVEKPRARGGASRNTTKG